MTQINIGLIPDDGTGDTLRQAALKINQSMQDCFNVRSYGAKGDGGTDDTAAFQAAILAAGTGGMVFVPPGTYVISNTLTLVEGITIQGAGRLVSKINMTANVSLFQQLGGTIRHLQIFDLFLNDTLGAGRTAGHAIEVGTIGINATECEFARLNIGGFFDGIHLSQLFVGSIHDIRVTSCKNDGFSYNGICTTLHTHATYANACTRYGYFVAGGSIYLAFTATAADTMGSDAYHFDRDPTFGITLGCTMTSPGAESNTGHSIYMKDCRGCTIISPRIAATTGVQKDGIRLDGCSFCSVHGGAIESCTGWGLNILTSATPATPTDNFVDHVYFNANALGQFNDPQVSAIRFLGNQLSSNVGVINPVGAVTSNYTAAAGDFGLNCDPTGGAFTLTLPTSGSGIVTGKMYRVKHKSGSGNNVTVVGQTGLVDNAASKTLTSLQGFTFQFDGTNYWSG